jgi:hypothetical protein
MIHATLSALSSSAPSHKTRSHPAIEKAVPAVILASLLAALLTVPLNVQAETVRDCKVTGTVKRASASSENVFVALHSVRPAESGSPCNIRRKEKLQFKLPSSPELANAKPGTRVEYRYTEDSREGSSWKLQKVSK